MLLGDLLRARSRTVEDVVAMQTSVMTEGAEVVAFNQVVARRSILTCTNNVTRGRRLSIDSQLTLTLKARLPP